MNCATCDTSMTAIGTAKASEIALQRSISGWMLGNVPSFRKRRSSASDAHRYWVGFNPIRENARRCIEAGTDALHVIKWKELYDLIEEAIDNCEDVGNTLERIVLKNG